MNKKSIKLAAMFTLVVFAVIAATMILISSIAMLLLDLGAIQINDFQEEGRGLAFVIFPAIGIAIGTVLARMGSKVMAAPIVEISEATKKVAKGNFDISLKKASHTKEIDEMAKNFLLMARELSHTETMHNDFINNVSHEFKTPLSAIEGYAMLLQNKSLSEEKREAYVSKILYNTKRLSSLTGNILQLSRLENQEITTEKTRFSLDEQIRQDVLMFEDQWSGKSLELDVDLDQIDYFGNSDLLSRVWQNLIGNAMKYVSDGGSVRVVLRKEEDSAKVYISDNGIGMSDEVKKRVFEKFYQGDTSHGADGNGLGLTLAKRIVDLHNGTIVISSAEGEGATFSVTLPIV